MRYEYQVDLWRQIHLNFCNEMLAFHIHTYVLYICSGLCASMDSVTSFEIQLNSNKENNNFPASGIFIVNWSKNFDNGTKIFNSRQLYWRKGNYIRNIYNRKYGYIYLIVQTISFATSLNYNTIWMY